ncbi:AAA family ATPase [Roseibium sp. MMSF_3412]|uniref:AAA family ATPase n=1 Tax=Roseibium sp. MMSF_3412 TaxID=3046712 RepID=UPI0027402996|nr:AAA family ATPase [Roseibium sp. MMSF_3412]
MKKPEPAFRRLSEYEPKKINWFWDQFIPFGMTTVVEGDPGLGKSYLLMHLSASLTTGTKLPTGKRIRPTDVVYCTTEDSYHYTFSPRIKALGGNPDKIWVQEKYSAMDDNGLQTLRSLVKRRKPGLIVLDPLFNYVPADRNAYSPNEIRAIMGELNEIGESADAAVLLIRHLTKTKRDKQIYQGAGGIDVIGFARSAMRIEKHPDNPDLRLMVHLKWNLTTQSKSWVYEVVKRDGEDLPVIVWRGQCDISIDDLGRDDNGEGPPPRRTAFEFLRAELANGPMPAKYLLEKAENEGIKKRTLDRAKSKLNVIVEQQKRKWVWRLPVDR